MKKKVYDYTERQRRNDQSRNEAKNYMERWDETEVATLQELWTTDKDELEALASLLGRTVEACRQKHYELSQQPDRVAAEKLKKIDKWSQGFTSLADMGF